MRPWEKDLKPDDGAWDAYGYWERWIAAHMPPEAGEAFYEVDDRGSWKTSLYAICCGLCDGDYR